MYRNYLPAIIIIFVSFLNAQNEVDALRYSLFDNYSTARISSLGGSFSSLGGNTGAIHSNPATLATYRTNEFSISLTSDQETTTTNYLNNKNTFENGLKLSFQNIGYVQTIPVENLNGWNRLNYAFSYNKRKDLNKTINISGYNNESSMTNVFLHGAEGTTPDALNEFSNYLAFWTYLIDTIADWSGNGPNTSYLSSVNAVGQTQHMSITENGGIYDFDIAISGAYKDFLFLGTSIVISEIDFSQHNRYLENGFESKENQLTSFNYNQDLYVNGTGLNFKIGAIIKPTHFIRIGWAYHSKTYYELEETYETNMTTLFTNNENFTANSPLNYFNYELNTPSKSIGSLGLVLGKYGFITFDYETIDYGSSNLYSYIYNFSEENSNISNFYAKTNNLKIGAEAKIKNIGIRAGYAVFGSPFQNNLNDGKKKYLSGGIGFQKGQYFFDLAIISAISEEDYIIYTNPSNNLAYSSDVETTNQSLIISCQYKF